MLALCIVAAGCTTVAIRSPAPEEALYTAKPYGISSPMLRAWGDELGAEAAEELMGSRVSAMRRAAAMRPLPRGTATGPVDRPMLALSGGGADGAFGAGLLAGWTARGDRPEFAVVSGVSTGAIIALFAFLGPEFDDTLREVYTRYETRDLLTPGILRGLLGGSAIADATGFRRLIDRYVDDDVVQRLAEAHENGRLLLIGTTNLDATRPVVWNIGEIAASGHPQAERLIEDVIQASAAIPGVFPPVMIPVETDDGRFDEMHVDGGTTRQVLLFSPELRQRSLDEALGVAFDRRLYMVVNNRLRRSYRPVEPRLPPIAATAISSLIAGSGNGDVLQLTVMAERERIPVGIISIPEEFERESLEPFDRDYMSALYDFGYTLGVEGVPWRTRPPGFEEPEGAQPGMRLASRP